MMFRKNELYEIRRSRLTTRMSHARARCLGLKKIHLKNADTVYICRHCAYLLSEGTDIVLHLLSPRDLNAEQAFLDQAFDLIRKVENILSASLNSSSAIESELLPTATELKDLIIEYAKL